MGETGINQRIILYLTTSCDKKMKEKLTETLNTLVGGSDLVWDASPGKVTFELRYKG